MHFYLNNTMLTDLYNEMKNQILLAYFFQYFGSQSIEMESPEFVRKALKHFRLVSQLQLCFAIAIVQYFMHLA